jgi:DNA-binding response OmpR family regulator
VGKRPVADLLIVDDDPDGAEALAAIMQLHGHEVRVAYNGQEGMRLATEGTPEVALLDVEMPVMTGPGMAYQMLIHDMGLEDVPVVFLSGVSNLREVAGQVGTPYYLGKPYRIEQLIALLGRALRERIAPRPAPAATVPASGE